MPMKLKKHLLTAAMLACMTTAVTPAVPVFAAQVDGKPHHNGHQRSDKQQMLPGEKAFCGTLITAEAKKLFHRKPLFTSTIQVYILADTFGFVQRKCYKKFKKVTKFFNLSIQ